MLNAFLHYSVFQAVALKMNLPDKSIDLPLHVLSLHESFNPNTKSLIQTHRNVKETNSYFIEIL